MANRSGYDTSDSDMESSDLKVQWSGNKTELQIEKQKNADLRAQVEEYKSQLIELASEGDEISDTTIQTNYEHLCKEIEKWVDDVIIEESRPFDEVWNRSRTGPDGPKIDKVVMSRLIDTSDQPIVNADVLAWLGAQKYLNCLILSLIIWHFLEINVFDKHFPIGTPTVQHGNPEQSLLRDIYECMKRKPQGAFASIMS
jgi:hypothetical protein